jgi:hypothetical protein
MAGGIHETVPNVLKTLWNLESDLRSAARSGVILQSEDARTHLAQARHHLDRLLGLSRGSEETRNTESSNSAITSNDQL